MNQIVGQSVFSLETRRPKEYKVEGLSGTRVTSIEELDEKVSALLMGPHNGWVEDYLTKRDRRVEDE